MRHLWPLQLLAAGPIKCAISGSGIATNSDPFHSAKWQIVIGTCRKPVRNSTTDCFETFMFGRVTYTLDACSVGDLISWLGSVLAKGECMYHLASGPLLMFDEFES